MQTKPNRSASTSTTTELVGEFLSAWSGRVRRGAGGAPVFTLDDVKVSDHDLGSPSGLLPVFAWHADSLYQFAVRKKGLGIEFHEDDEALLHRAVSFDRIDRATSEVLCFVLEAAEDARAHLPASLNVPGAIEIRSLVSRFAAEMGVSLRASPIDGAESSASIKPAA